MCLFSRFELLEEVVALVIHKDESGEVFHFNLPDGLHTQFGILYALNALDVVLSQDSGRTTDRAEVETTMPVSYTHLTLPTTARV